MCKRVQDWTMLGRKITTEVQGRPLVCRLAQHLVAFRADPAPQREP